MRKISVVMVLFLFFMLTGPTPHTPAIERTSKARVMAMYLYSFLLFVDWPQDVFNWNDRINIVVAGDDLLFDFLKPMTEKSLRGKRVVVEQMKSVQDLGTTCHVLFIGSSKQALAPRLLQETKDGYALTVSDMERFTEMGGMVLFKNIGDPTDKTGYPRRFEINLTAVKRAGLKIRSRILRLSDIVY